MEGIKLRTIKYFNRGNALNKDGVYEKAIEYYDRVIKIDPTNHAAWSHKARSLVELGKINEAMICYNTAIELRPNNASLWNNKGYAFLKQVQYNTAIECYDKALELRPKYARAWYNKGYSLDKLEKYEESLKCFDKAIELDSNNEKYVLSKESILEKVRTMKKLSECPSPLKRVKEPQQMRSNSSESLTVQTDISGSTNVSVILESLYNAINKAQTSEALSIFEYPLTDILSSIKEKKEKLIRNKNVDSNQTCVICLDAQSDMVCIPCGHMCLCEGCKALLTKKKCPICNQLVKNIYKVQTE